MKKLFSVLCVFLIICAMLSGCSQKSAASAGFTLNTVYDAHYSDVDSEAIEAYESICNAVINGESSVTVNNSYYDDASRLFYVSFPLSQLVRDIALNSDGSLRIVYTQTTSRHLELVEEFTDRVYSILSKCGYPDASENELLLNIYTYVSENTEQDLTYSSAYDALVSGVGSSSGYEAAFRYLIQQAGISASRVYGISYDGTHFMTEAEIDGEFYFFDPCAENTYSGGKGLSYFGMGVIGLQQIGVGSDVSYSDDTPIPFEENSARFDSLFQTVSYTYSDGKVSAKKNNGEIVEVAL